MKWNLPGIVLVLSFLVVTGQCGPQSPESETNTLRSYACSGVVQRVVPGEHVINIHHKAIPDFMPEMTMDFKIKDANLLQKVSPGDKIKFNLQVLPDDAWIENLHLVAHGRMPVAAEKAPPASADLKAGDVWPDGELLDERGRIIRFSDFRGQAVAVNFFFTRCPLPNFCPRLNRNFAEAGKLLSETPGAPTNFWFLSISFDPDNDRPAILADYARLYRDSGAERWLFAVASTNLLGRLPAQLGLWFKREGSAITHNLRTVVLDPQGRVYRQFNGNEWTAQQLASAMEEAGQQAAPSDPPLFDPTASLALPSAGQKPPLTASTESQGNAKGPP